MRVRMTVMAEAQSMPFTHPRSSLKELLRICCKKNQESEPKMRDMKWSVSTEVDTVTWMH